MSERERHSRVKNARPGRFPEPARTSPRRSRPCPRVRARPRLENARRGVPRRRRRRGFRASALPPSPALPMGSWGVSPPGRVATRVAETRRTYARRFRDARARARGSSGRRRRVRSGRRRRVRSGRRRRVRREGGEESSGRSRVLGGGSIVLFEVTTPSREDPRAIDPTGSVDIEPVAAPRSGEKRKSAFVDDANAVSNAPSIDPEAKAAKASTKAAARRTAANARGAARKEAAAPPRRLRVSRRETPTIGAEGREGREGARDEGARLSRDSKTSPAPRPIRSSPWT